MCESVFNPYAPEFYEYVQKNQPNICEMTVIKSGKICYDETWHDFKKTDTLHTMSVTKSVVSLLVGIAIDKGLIKSVDDFVIDYFPEYKIKRGEKTIQQVTIRNLLTMTAPYKYKSEPWSAICSQDDWTTAALDYLGGRKGITGEYKYSTLGIHILTGIIAKQSKMSTVDFANKFLFSPLSIDNRKIYVAPDAEAHKKFTIEKTPKGQIWFSDPCGVGSAGFGLCLCANEMAKIGQLCLQKGIYNGRRIVSEEWLETSTETKVLTNRNFQDMEYGYLWWIIDSSKHIYAAIGNSGNVIYVNPEKELVVAVSAYFKPTVLDRIDFIQKIEEYL